MIYCDIGGLRTADYDDREKDAKYLISCKGKLLRAGIGGFVKQQAKIDAENTRLGNIENSQKLFRRTQNVLLTLVAVGTLAAAFYYLTELYWNHKWFQSCFWWAIVLLTVVVFSYPTYLIWKRLKKKKVSQQVLPQ